MWPTHPPWSSVIESLRTVSALRHPANEGGHMVIFDVFVSRDMTTYVTYRLSFVRHASRLFFLFLFLEKYRGHMVKF